MRCQKPERQRRAVARYKLATDEHRFTLIGSTTSTTVLICAYLCKSAANFFRKLPSLTVGLLTQSYCAPAVRDSAGFHGGRVLRAAFSFFKPSAQSACIKV